MPLCIHTPQVFTAASCLLLGNPRRLSARSPSMGRWWCRILSLGGSAQLLTVGWDLSRVSSSAVADGSGGLVLPPLVPLPTHVAEIWPPTHHGCLLAPSVSGHPSLRPQKCSPLASGLVQHVALVHVHCSCALLPGSSSQEH